MEYLVHHMLQASAGRFPSKEALVHGQERLTYREVTDRVEGLAAGLKQAGLQRGDRIGIYLEASVAQVIAIFAISRAGGVFVPINAQLFPEQLSHIARDCGMKGLITTTAKLPALSAVLQELPALEFLVTVG